MYKTAANLRTLLTALWLGAAIFFSFAVAPAAFSVLPSREAAASVVNRTLAIVNYSGFIIGLLLLAGNFYFKRTTARVKFLVEQMLLLLFLAACAFGQFVIGARIHELRRSIGQPIETLAANDSLRVAFDNLHAYSVWILTAAMISAMIVFFLFANRADDQREKEIR